MTLRIYLLTLVAALLFSCSFADTSIPLTPQPTACNKACIQPAVQPQCPTVCPNSCTFIVKDPCCPQVKTGICDNSSSSGAGTSASMTAAPTATSTASSLPTTGPSMVSSMSSSSASGSSVAPATQTTPSVSSSSRLSSDIIETKYALLAVMFAVLALF